MVIINFPDKQEKKNNNNNKIIIIIIIIEKKIEINSCQVKKNWGKILVGKKKVREKFGHLQKIQSLFTNFFFRDKVTDKTAMKEKC